VDARPLGLRRGGEEVMKKLFCGERRALISLLVGGQAALNPKP